MCVALGSACRAVTAASAEHPPAAFAPPLSVPPPPRTEQHSRPADTPHLHVHCALTSSTTRPATSGPTAAPSSRSSTSSEKSSQPQCPTKRCGLGERTRALATRCIAQTARRLRALLARCIRPRACIFTILISHGRCRLPSPPLTRQGADKWDYIFWCIFAGGALSCLFFSTSFHIQMHHSAAVYERTIMLDFVGIVLLIW